MIKRLCFITSLLFLLPVFQGCSFTPSNNVPYMVSGDFVMEEASEDYSVCGIDLTIFNQSEKNISNFSIVFFLFDKDGEPARECSNRIAFDIQKIISSGESFNKCISLDKYMITFPEEELFVDYLYVSQIVYEDGSTWEDPYGLVAFK